MEGRGFNLLLIQKGVLGLLCATVLYLSPLGLAYAEEEKLKLDEPLVQPNVERRKIHKVGIDTENLELGVFGGFYAAEDFGTNPVVGARLAYHVTEDLFFEASMGATDTSKNVAEEAFRFNLVAEDKRELTYYNILVGYNMLPGEVFFGSNWAFNFAFYIVGGVGSTDFNDERRATVVSGGGMRILFTDWMAFHLDVRDHVFRQTIPTVEKTVHNIESFLSLTFYF